MIDCRKNSFFFIKESSSCYSFFKFDEKNENKNVKSRNEAEILKNSAVVPDKSSTYVKIYPITP